ncbi:hypothetical protein BDW71DRAFT_172112 [Aspergillus fruticulosus]
MKVMSFKPWGRRLLQIMPAIMVRDIHSWIMMATYHVIPNPTTSICQIWSESQKSSIFT